MSPGRSSWLRSTVPSADGRRLRRRADVDDLRRRPPTRRRSRRPRSRRRRCSVQRRRWARRCPRSRRRSCCRPLRSASSSPPRTPVPSRITPATTRTATSAATMAMVRFAALGPLGAALELPLQVALGGLAALLVRRHGCFCSSGGTGRAGCAGGWAAADARRGQPASLGGAAWTVPWTSRTPSWLPRNLHGCSSARSPPAPSAPTATSSRPGPGRSASSSTPAWTPSSRSPGCWPSDRLKPVAVVLTHGHLDHTFSVLPVCDGYDIPAYLHPADSGMLSDPARLARPAARPLIAGRAAARPVRGEAARRRRACCRWPASS